MSTHLGGHISVDYVYPPRRSYLGGICLPTSAVISGWNMSTHLGAHIAVALADMWGLTPDRGRHLGQHLPHEVDLAELGSHVQSSQTSLEIKHSAH